MYIFGGKHDMGYLNDVHRMQITESSTWPSMMSSW